MPNFNIEVKSRPEWDNIFHPEVSEYCDLVLEIVRDADIEERVIIQSFDIRCLQYMHEKYPDMKLAYLTENLVSWERNLKELGFQPDIYSPYFPQLSPNAIKAMQDEGMKVIPWTINDSSDIRTFIEMGIDGIISDYPNRVVEILEDLKQS